MFWNTVNDSLKYTLLKIMAEPLFNPFRLVGGTALSLQLGHRESVDIDIFTDAPYGTIDFSKLEHWFRNEFEYVNTNNVSQIGLGTSYFVGTDSQNLIKLDIYHTDKFIRPALIDDFIRIADKEDIIAMKLDIIGRDDGNCGRKKDYWDIHAIQDIYTLKEVIEIYQERYPYGNEIKNIISGLTNFSNADDDFDPICLQGKHWELIKLDFIKWVEQG